jgi:peptide/nickel transport system permease protein
MPLLTAAIHKLITLICVVGLVFLLIHMVPGDPVLVLLGERASAADQQALREALGLNQSLITQFGRFLAGLLRGDWGTSMVSHKPVLTVMAERIPATAALAAVAMVMALVMGFALGVAMVWGSKPLRAGLGGLSLAMLVTPSFVLGPLLIVVFSLGLGLFPVSGYNGASSLVLPALTLGASLAAVIARMLAASLYTETKKDYVRSVYAKGGSLWRARAHAVRNGLLPVVQIVFLQMGMLLTGTVLAEAVFGWPGLGNLLVESLHQRDYPVIQGCLLLISLTYMVCVALADLTSAWLDPRIRSGRSAA